MPKAGETFGVYWDDRFFGAYWMDSFGHWSKAVEALPVSVPKVRIHDTEYQFLPFLDGQGAEVRFPQKTGHDTFAIAAHEQVLYFCRVSNPAVIGSAPFQALPEAREGFHFRFGPTTQPEPSRVGFDEYQREAVRTATGDYPPPYHLGAWALGLTGEVGKVAEVVEKYVYHDHDLDLESVRSEIGTVLWHVAVLAEELGFSLQDVAEENIAKLRAQYPEKVS